MNNWFIGDPHLGHRSISKYRGLSVEENTAWIVDAWKAKVGKRDRVWVLGDVAFSPEDLTAVKELPGKSKILIKGNHDDYTTTEEQMAVFDEIHGMVKLKEFWLTHCPMHPQELRGRPNIHGHVHDCTVDDPRYLNTCCEQLQKVFDTPIIDLYQVRAHFDSRGRVIYRCTHCDAKFTCFPGFDKVECPRSHSNTYCKHSIPQQLHYPGS